MWTNSPGSRSRGESSNFLTSMAPAPVLFGHAEPAGKIQTSRASQCG